MRNCSIEGCTTIGKSRGYCNTHYQAMRRQGLFEKLDNPVAIQFANPKEIITRYNRGESENALALSLGVSRSVIRRVLLAHEVRPRDSTVANRLMMKSRTPEENQRNTAAAHVAARNHVHTLEEKTKRAATRELKQLHTSPNELYLAELLHKQGFESTPQKAIGVYNCDIAVGNVAIEIYGGVWHSSGSHAARSDERFRYIFDNGWRVAIIWVDERRYPLNARVLVPLLTYLRDTVQRENTLILRGNGTTFYQGRDPDLALLRRYPSEESAA
jgi:hypothetical protein